MNEMKPEDVLRELERIASEANCNNMRNLEGCGCFCIRLGKSVHDMAKGRNPECNENCEHFAPPLIEKVLRAALALLREKDAEIERLAHKCDDCAGCTQWKCDCSNIRAEAINEFAEKLKDVSEFFLHADKDGFLCCVDFMAWIDQIAKKMKGEQR